MAKVDDKSSKERPRKKPNNRKVNDLLLQTQLFKLENIAFFILSFQKFRNILRRRRYSQSNKAKFFS